MISAEDAVILKALHQKGWARIKRCLVAKVIIQRVPGKQGQRASDLDALKPHRTTWAIFLDDLSVLCDFHPAGLAVKAIAVEAATDHSIFWMASNASTTDDILTSKLHLKWMLGRLQEYINNQGPEEEEMAHEICKQSVQLAEGKVNNYVDCISKLLRGPKQDHVNMAPWKQVSAIATCVSATVLDPSMPNAELCEQAFLFRKTSCFHDLNELARTNIIAAKIVHYLGRLGSWAKAARSVTRKAQQFRVIMNHHSVDSIDIEDDLEFSIETKGDVKTIISSAISGPAPDEAVKVIEENSAAFLEKIQRRKQVAKVHAEAALLHHFLINRRKFARNEKYIGCSKPSCYACAAYFQVMGGTERQRHGNAWLQWAPPGSFTDSATVVNALADKLENDIRQHLQRDVMGRKRRFDSTTGITGRTDRMVI